MKTLLVLTLFIFLIPFSASAELTDDLVSFWSLEEESGTRLDDTDTGNDLTDNNTVSFTTGKIGNAADFELSETDYLSHLDNASLSITGDISASFWVKLEAGVPTNSNYYFIAKWSDSYRIFIEDEGGTENIVFGNISGGCNLQDKSGTTLTAGTTYHVAFRVLSGAYTLYIDNVSTATGTVCSSQNDNTSVFTLSGSGQHLDGWMDQVGLWDRALTTDEIGELYNNGDGLSYADMTGGGGGGGENIIFSYSDVYLPVAMLSTRKKITV